MPQELRALFNALAQRPIQAWDVAYRDWGLQCGLDIRQILLDGDQTVSLAFCSDGKTRAVELSL